MKVINFSMTKAKIAEVIKQHNKNIPTRKIIIHKKDGTVVTRSIKIKGLRITPLMEKSIYELYRLANKQLIKAHKAGLEYTTLPAVFTNNPGWMKYVNAGCEKTVYNIFRQLQRIEINSDQFVGRFIIRRRDHGSSMNYELFLNSTFPHYTNFETKIDQQKNVDAEIENQLFAWYEKKRLPLNEVNDFTIKLSNKKVNTLCSTQHKQAEKSKKIPTPMQPVENSFLAAAETIPTDDQSRINERVPVSGARLDPKFMQLYSKVIFLWNLIYKGYFINCKFISRSQKTFALHFFMQFIESAKNENIAFNELQERLIIAMKHAEKQKEKNPDYSYQLPSTFFRIGSKKYSFQQTKKKFLEYQETKRRNEKRLDQMYFAIQQQKIFYNAVARYSTDPLNNYFIAEDYLQKKAPEYLDMFKETAAMHTGTLMNVVKQHEKIKAPVSLANFIKQNFSHYV